jgi:hypothetical protein
VAALAPGVLVLVSPYLFKRIQRATPGTRGGIHPLHYIYMTKRGMCEMRGEDVARVCVGWCIYFIPGIGC